ncbi:hypothetical protein ACGFJC_45580 [Nonomuraea fuscirosea]|uniref:hypothetical protein n=1 Tax=Nonomuraea fuscirosea TaxID=1291556 RepID=UPI00342DD31E
MIFKKSRAWLMVLMSVALVLVVGARVVDRDEPEPVRRSVPEPVVSGSAPNAKIIDKDQRIDLDTFDQKDSPQWPFVEKLRRAATTRPGG